MSLYTSKVPNDPKSRCAVFNNGQRITPSEDGLIDCPSTTTVTSSPPATNVPANPTLNPATNVPANPTLDPAVNVPANPTPNPTASSVVKHGLQGGAVAGIAIGMLLAGVLIAGLVFFFMLRRQKTRGQYTSHAGSHVPLATYQSRPEKGPVIVASAVPNSIDRLLPQPDSDDTLVGEVSRIRDNIKNHVRVYYHSGPLNSGINEAALLDVASATGLSTSTLASALSDPSARQETLRLVVAWVILAKATGGRSADLLPPGISQLENAITGRSEDSIPEQIALHSKWKTITALLLSQGAENNDQNADRVQTFSQIITELDSIVGPCSQGHPGDAQRRKNLDMILTRASKFAFLLFSQPGSFRFEFRSRQSAIRAFPALVQTVGDQGQVLGHPRVLFEG